MQEGAVRLASGPQVPTRKRRDSSDHDQYTRTGANRPVRDGYSIAPEAPGTYQNKAASYTLQNHHDTTAENRPQTLFFRPAANNVLPMR